MCLESGEGKTSPADRCLKYRYIANKTEAFRDPPVPICLVMINGGGCCLNCIQKALKEPAKSSSAVKELFCIEA